MKLTLLAAFLAAAGPALAEPIPNPGSEPTPAPAAETLALADALRQAYQRRPAVEAAFLDLRLAEQALIAARGLFDPVLDAEVETGVDRTPGQLGDDQRVESTTAATSISGLTPWGSSYALGFDAARAETETGGATYGPLTSDGAHAALTQPLLRGGWAAANLAEVHAAEIDRALAWVALESEVAGLIYRVGSAYWELAYAFEDRQVAGDSLARGQALLAADETRVARGAMAPVELLQARLSVATREAELVSATARLKAAVDRLQREMGIPPAAWQSALAVHQPQAPAGLVLEPDLLDDAALAGNLDLVRLQLAVERARNDLEAAHLLTLPGLDLTGRAGLASQDEDAGSAAEELWREDAGSWSVGLRLSWPIPNRTNRALAGSRRLTFQRTERLLAEGRLSAAAELRAAARQFEAQAERVAITRRATALAAENLAAEEKRFEVGVSTQFQLIEFQERLAEVERSEARSRIDLALAALELDRVRGLLSGYVWSGPIDPWSTPALPAYDPKEALDE